VKIEIQKKIIITPNEGEPIIAFEDTMASETKNLNAIVNMITVGNEQMEIESKKAMLLKIDELKGA
jgi:hypothetical protein